MPFVNCLYKGSWMEITDATLYCEPQDVVEMAMSDDGAA